MIKKIMLCVLFVTSLFALSCSKSPNTDTSTFEIAVLIDLGPIDDKSFNQGSWEGVKDYAENYGISYKYYRVPDKDIDSYLNTIDLAVQCGAKLIVTPGYMFEPAIYKAQDIYTNVNFILIDGEPQDGTYTDYKTSPNTVAILYSEEEAGFLAGYSIVKEGYTNLGFMGGVAHPAVVRFGYGFVQGADYAAVESKLPKDSVNIKYTYIGNYDPTPENQTLATSWYKSGVQVIFAAAGAAGNSVMSAAENNNGLVIGVDVDQSFESPTVITSAMKLIRESVYNAVASYYNGNFSGGKTTILGAQVKGIGLPMATSKFQVFTEADYNIIYDSLVTKTIKVLKDTDVESVNDLHLNSAKVNYIK
ncbi:BMP family ABC transporter substrate-binding protein [Brachyspira hyodysenteriae]|uniref:BMP family lipoprotein n=1 Tax=Brachyspira hyodysenteriae TaxID=159 RepID=UPI0022CDBA64|nr:BMP family ABC transporter substrate-binding protein [Brachyspira hyodysenteriae]MCZ9838991.1 BMP family ABC transporter substrate-binding protein [Brachyspira hyodysenteriae]MCZ9847610.1 BMP family ABC transporter substrate-binding protein [Brachyspira hyodysenteriae]MCZ9851459.1 BMP family ABC transporter substrate-binding protein [Brachyspira hyodysenteriae]MCZ9859814.1 BMP family ABC transporter substrate-binding protein [Brachyspira hyodysenteriae]MCZ9871010.1 BMP family ABC transporte